MLNHPLPRIDKDEELHHLLLPFCRLKKNDVWIDPDKKHKVACLDTNETELIIKAAGRKKVTLAVHDPPYNFVAFGEKKTEDFINWSRNWISLTDKCLAENSSLYVWIGADQERHYQPFGDFLKMMSETKFKSRSFITMRNQRGFGTQSNWMAIRQELLYYTKGKPFFSVDAEYTDIPKVLKGYYKDINGNRTENFERSKSNFIRAGNVWIDIQQVFYRMEENVNGCYAQKPLKAIERIILASSKEKQIVLDFFAHSGTTLIACEKLNRKCFTIDIDPVFCEISIRRIENYRKTGKTGWQNSNPFFNEIINSDKIKKYLKSKYKITYNRS